MVSNEPQEEAKTCEANFEHCPKETVNRRQKGILRYFSAGRQSVLEASLGLWLKQI